MIQLVLKNNDKLDYDEDSNKIYYNGELDKSWTPTFLPSGKSDELDFFGFVNNKTKKVYDIYGGISEVSKEDLIKI